MRAFEYENLIFEELLTEFGRLEKKSFRELVDMYHLLQRIIDEVEQEGERENARRLLAKVEAHLKNKYDWSPPAEKPKAKSQAHRRASGAYQKATGDKFQVVFCGRFVDPLKGKRGSDKVWGWGVKGDKIYQFWGPTGKTPQVKTIPNTDFNRDAVNRKAMDKQAKGYRKMSAADSAEWIRQVLYRTPKFSA